MLRDAATRAAWSLAVLTPACNAQFEFDTGPRDAAFSTPDGIARVEDASEAGLDATEEPVRQPSDGSTADALPDGGHTRRIACGKSSCALPSRYCCSTASTDECVDARNPTCSGVLLRCDESKDCAPGEICCAEGPNSRVTHSECKEARLCAGKGQFILCDPVDTEPCTACVGATIPLLPPDYHQCQ